MSNLPHVSGQAAVRAFERAGFTVDRTKGSHVILKKPGNRYHLSIPCHTGKTLGLGLLKKQIQLAGLSENEFCNLLR